MTKRALIIGVNGMDGSDLLLSKGYAACGTERRFATKSRENTAHLESNGYSSSVSTLIKKKVAKTCASL